MDGLDVEEIQLANLENAFTLGAEYYGKVYVSTADTIKRLNHVTLQGMSKLITDGDHGSPDYQESGILYLLSESVQEGYIDTSKCRFITPEKNAELRRSELHPGDIVVTKTGVYFGKSAVIPESIRKANMIAHVGKIKLKSGYNPYYVSTFLNSKYGYYQLRRRGIKATRPEIKLVEFSEIMVPVFSDRLDEKVEAILGDANRILSASVDVMKECESALLKAVGFQAAVSSDSGCAIRSFADSYCRSGRLDAEYYQPKYEAIARSLNTSETVRSLCRLHDEPFLPKNHVKYPYIELADVGQSGDISGVDVQYGAELPTRARRVVKSGQIIVASVEGSMQSCALITDEYDGALCSTGFYVLDSDKMNAETLLVLFKSEPIQTLMKQRCSGTILTAISKDELLSMPLPLVDARIQEGIAAKVQEAFALRKQAKQLLEYAKKWQLSKGKTRRWGGCTIRSAKGTENRKRGIDVNITVYLGAKEGTDPELKKAVQKLGEWIGASGNALVYGGSKSGLMGAIADSVLEAHGEVIGVEPEFFIKDEFQHEGLTKLIVTKDMFERKSKMIELGDVFIAFPGGTGTLEEITEVMSKVSLKHLNAPCILYNLNGYYNSLKALLAHMIEAGLSSKERQEGIYFAESLDEIKRILRLA